MSAKEYSHKKIGFKEKNPISSFYNDKQQIRNTSEQNKMNVSISSYLGNIILIFLTDDLFLSTQVIISLRRSIKYNLNNLNHPPRLPQNLPLLSEVFLLLSLYLFLSSGFGLFIKLNPID